MTEPIKVTHDQHIATVQFNRPEAYNALNLDMATTLAAITDDLRVNEKTKVVVLEGMGKAFMAGGDIGFFNENIASMPDGVLKIIRLVNAAIMNIVSMPKPVIARVHGSVAGVGMSFMLATDLVVASAETKFTMAYSNLGTSPDGGATYFLSRLVGRQKAMALLLFSELFDAKQAEAMGLVNWVVPTDMLATHTEQVVQKLLSGPSIAYRNIKRLVGRTDLSDLAMQLECEAQAFCECASTKDFRRGVEAFISKSRPEFAGE